MTQVSCKWSIGLIFGASSRFQSLVDNLKLQFAFDRVRHQRQIRGTAERDRPMPGKRVQFDDETWQRSMRSQVSKARLSKNLQTKPSRNFSRSTTSPSVSRRR